MSAAQHKNILVIKLGALGDMVQAFGAMKAIRAHHSTAKITLLTTQPFVGLAQQCGYCDDIIVDTRPKIYNIPALLRLRKALTYSGYDRVYDLQNNDRTAFYFRLIPARHKPEWVGVAKGASHRNTSPSRTAGLAHDGHKQTLANAGLNDVAIDTLDWIAPNSATFNLPRLYALLVIGSSPQHPYKRWPIGHFVALAAHLSQQGITPVLIGAKDEVDLGEAFMQQFSQAVNLIGKTSLTDIVGLAHDAQCAIGNDTGPIHMIAPTACPTLVLFSGRSNPKRHAPLGQNVKTLQHDNIDMVTCDDVYAALNTLGVQHMTEITQ